MFSQFRWSRCPIPDTGKLHTAHSRLVQVLKNKAASWTHLQCHSQTYTEKKPEVPRGEWSGASHRAISSHVFPPVSREIKIKRQLWQKHELQLVLPCPHSRHHSHSDAAPTALTSVLLHGCVWTGSLKQFRLKIHHHNHQEELILTQIIAVIPLGFCSDGISGNMTSILVTITANWTPPILCS